MKRSSKLIIIGSVVVAAGLFVAGYFILGGKNAPVLSSVTVAPTDLTEQVSMTGKVKAAEEVDLSFERGGRVVAVPVKAGDTVRRGALVAAIDGSGAKAASEEADAALASAQIALEKMKRPPEALDLLQAENAVAAASDAKDKAASDLAKANDNAASASDNAILDMRTVISGLKDILHSNDLNPGQDNLDYYADTAKVYDVNADAYRSTAENSYQAAKNAYDAAVANNDVSVSYDMTKSVSDAAKSTGDLINLYIGKLTEKQIAVPTVATGASATVAGYVAKANGDFAALSSAQSASAAAQNTAASTARALTEKQEALAKLKAGAEDIDIRAQQTRVDEAQAADAAAHSEASKTALVAPFDGTISLVNVSVGELASPGAPAVSMVSNAHYEIEAFVSEADIAKVAIGAPATVTLDTFGSGEIFAAYVASVDPAETIANGIGAYGVKLQFANDDSRIRSGMTANISIETGKRAGALAVPESAIITRGSGKFVLVDNGSAKPIETAVTVGIAGEGGLVEIVSGLKAGDKVVTYGNN